MKRSLKLFVFLFVMLGLSVASTRAYAATDLISTWELTPATTTISGVLTTNITFSVNDPADQDHQFCIQGPTHTGDSSTNWYNMMPTSIDLTGSRGFTSETITFTKDTEVNSNAACLGGSYVALYNGTTTAFSAGVDITFTTDTGTEIYLADGGNTAAAGTGNWVLAIANGAGTPGSLTTSVELIDNPDTIYVSDSPTCLGFGIADISCFQIFVEGHFAAIDAGATTLVVVGDLTVPGDEGVVFDGTGDIVGPSYINPVTTLRGTNNGRILAETCTDAFFPPTPIFAAMDGLTVTDLTIDGAGCAADVAFGIFVINGDITIDNVTFSNFNYDDDGCCYSVGLVFDADGAPFFTPTGTVRNSTFTNNAAGIVAFETDSVSIGTSPTDGNVFTNNTYGIELYPFGSNLSVIGNTITGGDVGIYLESDIDNIYGNSVTGAALYQIECDFGTLGAAVNYLGGISPTSGSNCSDVTSQIGSPVSSWSVGSSHGDITIGGASGTTAIFQLADDPYTYGEGMSDLAGFYAVMNPAGDGAITHAGSGGNQAKMNLDASGCSPMTNSCWVSVNDDESRAVAARAQTGSGYYALGNVDPSAVTLSNITAVPSSDWLRVVVLAVLLTLVTGFFLSKKEQTD